MSEKTIKAQATGRNGQIDFDINVDHERITDIKVTKSSETPGIFKQVVGKLKENIIENQSFDVDAISGASIMTKAMLDSGKKALEESGVSVASHLKKAEHKNVTLEVDVAVIGSGMAGLMAACRALAMGKTVLLIEKNGYLGGATILNGSNVVGTGSKVSAKLFGNKAQDDSPALLAKDISRECRGTNYPVLSNLLVNNIGKAVDFITEFADLTYQKAETQTIEHTVDRQIEMPSESSFELISKVSEAFLKKGGQILRETRVEKLNKNEQGQLVSLVAESKYETVKVNFKSLVMAAGGWGARDYREHMTDIPYYGPMTSMGDYFDFAKNMNLVSRNLDWYKIYPHGLEVEPGIAKLTTYSTKEASDMGAIFVNTSGKRIVNESAPYTHFRDAIATQKDKLAFVVMDERTWNKFYELLLKYGFTADEIQGFFNLEGKKSPILVKGDLQTVAQKAGINCANLQKTLANYAEAVKSGIDTEFGRPAQYMHEYVGDIYYVIEQKLRFCTTLGGYETNNHMQLLDKEFEPISNFYAAGEIIGGANGHDSMPSMMNSWSYASGFVAGTEAADNANSCQTSTAPSVDMDAATGATHK